MAVTLSRNTGGARRLLWHTKGTWRPGMSTASARTVCTQVPVLSCSASGTRLTFERPYVPPIVPSLAQRNLWLPSSPKEPSKQAACASQRDIRTGESMAVALSRFAPRKQRYFRGAKGDTCFLTSRGARGVRTVPPRRYLPASHHHASSGSLFSLATEADRWFCRAG
jgi:hypothetical protein